MELVRKGTQAMDNPIVLGTECQQGTLAACEGGEYLLDKWAENAPTGGREHSRASGAYRPKIMYDSTSKGALWQAIKKFGLLLRTESYKGKPKFNCSQFNIPKAPALDAACVGKHSRVEDWD
jgi:hypothetical protein